MGSGQADGGVCRKWSKNQAHSAFAALRVWGRQRRRTQGGGREQTNEARHPKEAAKVILVDGVPPTQIVYLCLGLAFNWFHKCVTVNIKYN